MVIVISNLFGFQRCINIRLVDIRFVDIVEDIKFLQIVFDFFTCRHVYRERNEEADQRSKEGANLDMGLWKISEFLNDHI